MNQSADEDFLIRAARAERGQHRSGASMAAMLGVAVVFCVVGSLLIFLPHVVRVLLPGPLGFLGAFSLPILVTLGIIAFAIAGMFLLGGLASSPLASWGNAAPGNCPRCGQPRLRSDMVPGSTGENRRDGARGIVTLCENPDCDYATARVTRASGATPG
ncbi:MAG TPA: hypothetical protein VHZ03_21690 [Trebonia sp.]|jgi:hypothetical protein|nr:hypothetical protein [Trebonia sp.]